MNVPSTPQADTSEARYTFPPLSEISTKLDEVRAALSAVADPAELMERTKRVQELSTAAIISASSARGFTPQEGATATQLMRDIAGALQSACERISLDVPSCAIVHETIANLHEDIDSLKRLAIPKAPASTPVSGRLTEWMTKIHLSLSVFFP